MAQLALDRHEYEDMHLEMNIVASALGIPVTDVKVTARWTRVFNLCCMLDSLLDDTDDRAAGYAAFNRAAAALGVQNWQPDYRPVQTVSTKDKDMIIAANAWAELTRSSLEDVSSKRRARMHETLVSIGQVTLDKSAATCVGDYVAASKAEGTLVADLIIDFLPDQFQELPQITALRNWTRYCCWRGALCDNVNDLQEDYEKGLTQIVPTGRNGRRLWVAAYASRLNMWRLNAPLRLYTFKECIRLERSKNNRKVRA